MSDEQQPQEHPQWSEQVAVTGRPNDVPLPNSTFADRAKARVRVKAVEPKTAGPADEAKPAPRKTARRKQD